MPKLPKAFLSLLSCLLMLAAAPIAMAAPVIDARLAVALVQGSGSSEVMAAATAAKPGDLLEYTVRYTNRGDASADALSPTLPIPAGTEYRPTEAGPQPTHASLDGKSFAPIPLKRSVKGKDGLMHDVDIPAVEYRALRWSMGSLAAGKDVTVRARVRVAQLEPLASR